jgi:hypothetical protein
MAHEEQQSAGPQVAFAGGGEDRAPGVAAHAMTGKRGDLAMVAVRHRARDRSIVPAPAAITLGVGICGAAGWLVVGAGRRRRHQVARVQSRR